MSMVREILIVEDNETTNFLNRRLTDKLEITDKLTIRKDGKLALSYLASLKKQWFTSSRTHPS